MSKLINTFIRNIEASELDFHKKAILAVLSDMNLTLGELNTFFKDLEEKGIWKNVSNISLQDLHDAAKGTPSKVAPAKKTAVGPIHAKEAKPDKVRRRMTQIQKTALIKLTTDFISANPWKSKSEIAEAVGAKAPNFNTVMRQLSREKVIKTKGPKAKALYAMVAADAPEQLKAEPKKAAPKKAAPKKVQKRGARKKGKKAPAQKTAVVEPITEDQPAKRKTILRKPQKKA